MHMKFIQPEWNAPKKVKAYTTLRQLYDNNRDLSYEENVLEIIKKLSLTSEPIWINQIHGTTVVPATPENKKTNADAAYTAHTNRICVIFTADCLPILICNKQGSKIAAIHAGWRGLAGGIVENTLSALNERAEDLLVWLGPAIGPQRFEVGMDVYDAFVNKHSTSASAFTPLANGKWLADLYTLAKIRLKLYGVEQIFGGHFCTYSQQDLFFSYRREQGQTGRMASLIWIEDDSIST